MNHDMKQYVKMTKYCRFFNEKLTKLFTLVIAIYTDITYNVTCII